MRERDVQRARAVQVGKLMRSYHESFSRGDSRRGLTQEALLERMGSVDSDYAVGFERTMNSSDIGLDGRPLHPMAPVSSVDSRDPSWYVLATTPIDSTVGSRPPSRAVSVFVWSRD